MTLRPNAPSDCPVRRRDKLAFLPASAWELDYEIKKNEGNEFLFTMALD